ncbi:hypothetical protein V2I01_29790 [Micromonospora sp. BRA006-A]|nr:hypothetical protein [Micromonospora sp. BRA006-A]
MLDRATPYHLPHSTQVAGYAVIYGGDDRYVGNLFLGGDPDAAYGAGAAGEGPPLAGTAGYDGHPASFAEYLARLAAQPPSDQQKYVEVRQPVYVRANTCAAGARPFEGEHEPLVLGAASAAVVAERDAVWLVTDLPEAFDEARIGVVTGRTWNGSGAPTRSSRKRTAAPPSWTSTSRANSGSRTGTAPSARSRASRPGHTVRACSDDDGPARTGRRTVAPAGATVRSELSRVRPSHPGPSRGPRACPPGAPPRTPRGGRADCGTTP